MFFGPGGAIVVGVLDSQTIGPEYGPLNRMYQSSAPGFCPFSLII